MVIQITTTIDEATHAEAKRRGIGWARAIEAGMTQLIKGQGIQDELDNLKDANNHLRYNNSTMKFQLEEALNQNILLRKELEVYNLSPVDIILNDRNKDVIHTETAQD